MNLLVPARRFNQNVPEMMDLPNPDLTILQEDLGNLRLINRYFGGLRAVRKHVLQLISKIDHSRTIQVLDLATGSADHPISLVHTARALNRRIRITAVERSPLTLSIARERTENYPEIVIEEGDLLELGYPPKSFDVVICSLAIHHFSRPDAVRILDMMTQWSRVGLIINDLRRSWLAAWTAWIYTHVTTTNPMTLNDSYVSVLRAFTARELREMADEAGVRDPQIFRHPMFRLILVGMH